MARVNEGSHRLPATHTFIHKWNEPYLFYFPAAVIVREVFNKADIKIEQLLFRVFHFKGTHV